MSGPKRPQDRIELEKVPENFSESFDNLSNEKHTIEIDNEKSEVGDSSVVIAAITSCTNTSNPYVMVGAGLLAKNAR